MKRNLELREIRKSDCQKISDAFQEQGWDKPTSQHERYLAYQASGERDVILAVWNEEFAGYLTIKWESDYPPFRQAGIPEIVDFNLLKKYQRLGIGTSLMAEAESRIKRISAHAGIGFGVYQDYGPAQVLYIKRGYIPDGSGISQDHEPIKKGSTVRIDDSIVFHLTRKLSTYINQTHKPTPHYENRFLYQNRLNHHCCKPEFANS